MSCKNTLASLRACTAGERAKWNGTQGNYFSLTEWYINCNVFAVEEVDDLE